MRSRIRRLNFFSRASLLTNKIIRFKNATLKNENLDPEILSDGLQSFRASCILGQSTLACDATDLLMHSILQGDVKNRSDHSTMYYSAYESIGDASWCPRLSTLDTASSAYFTAASSSIVLDIGAHKSCISIPDSTEPYFDDFIRHLHANYLSVSHRRQSQQERELERSTNDNEDGRSSNGFSGMHHDGDELWRVHSAADGFRYPLFPDTAAASVAHLSPMSSISLQAHRAFDNAFSDEDQMICFGIGRRARYYIALVVRSIGKSVISALNSILRALGLVGAKLKHYLICSFLCFIVYASGPPV
ncbi:hypothetical protein V1509DRAFT_617515 [Lipomyces kononenkoae]